MIKIAQIRFSREANAVDEQYHTIGFSLSHIPSGELSPGSEPFRFNGESL